jgi:hypothetical protein
MASLLDAALDIALNTALYAGENSGVKKRMTACLYSPRLLPSVNNEKEVILCLVIKGLCRKALFLFGGLRSSLLGARKTEPLR